jgi:hypothetical protein
MACKRVIAKYNIVILLCSCFLIISGCERPAKTPPSDSVLLVLENVREGFNQEDVDRFCKDFSAIMFTKGFTKKAYLDVIQGLKQRYGAWESEVYRGEDKGAHIWRVQFSRGKAKLVLVLNNDGQVIGLWFR